jgi:hypothetical protein
MIYKYEDTKYFILLIMRYSCLKPVKWLSYTGLHLLIFHKLKWEDVLPSPILIINYSIVSLVCRNRSEHGTMKLTVVIQRVWCIHRNSKVIVPASSIICNSRRICICSSRTLNGIYKRRMPYVDILKYMYLPTQAY